MKLSRKSDYALRALFGLIASDGRTVSIRELAEKYDVPKRFLEQIMPELKSKGWARRIAGRESSLAVAPSPGPLPMSGITRPDGWLRTLWPRFTKAPWSLAKKYFR